MSALGEAKARSASRQEAETWALAICPIRIEAER